MRGTPDRILVSNSTLQECLSGGLFTRLSFVESLTYAAWANPKLKTYI